MADKVWKEIEANHARFVDYVKNKEFAKIADMYTEDGIMMLSGAESVKGRKEIDDFCKNKLPSFGQLAHEKNQYFELMNETTAFSTELFSAKDSDGNLTGLFNSAFLWKKVDGQWLTSREFLTSCPLPQTKSEIQMHLDERLKDLYINMQKGDFEEATRLYAEDAVCIPEGHDPIVGRKAIMNFLRTLVPPLQPLIGVKISYFELMNDEKAFSNAGSKSFDSDGKLKAVYRDYVLWKKIDGQWYVDRESFHEATLPSN